MGLPNIAISFHGIGSPGRTIEPQEGRYWVSIDQFRSFLDEILLLPDPGSVLISFDDGNASDAEIALPLLLERGLTATFFVLVGRVGMPGSLSEAQITELHDAGMCIGSHGVCHIRWRGLKDAALSEELEGSRTWFQQALGLQVDTASIPFGRYDRHVAKALLKAGYLCAYTTDGGRLRPNSFLKSRTNIRADLSLAQFRQLIRGKESLRRHLRRLAIRVRHYIR